MMDSSLFSFRNSASSDNGQTPLYGFVPEVEVPADVRHRPLKFV
uniref:Uncharacterized protein n=1 Tax=Arundo donax TaxID=35708 RepID=A0A0A9GXL8_ARUDO